MMNEILRIVSAEKYKLVRRRSIIILPIGVILLSSAVFLTVDFATQRDWIGVSSGFYLASTAIGWMVNIIALLTVIFASFQVSGEFALGTVKPAWIRPVSRSAWFMGKLLSVSAYASILFLISLVTIISLASIKYGFSDLMEKDYLIHSVRTLSGRLVQSSMLTLLSLISLSIVTGMVATLFMRPGSTIAVLVILSFAMSVIAIFEQAGPYLLSNALINPFQQMKVMSKGLPLPYEWNDLIWRNAASAGVYLVLSLISGIWIINKKEITF